MSKKKRIRIVTTNVVPSKPPTKQFKRRIGAWGIAGVILTAFCVVLALPPFIDWLKPAKEKYEEQAFVKGELKPHKVTYKDTGYYRSEFPPVFYSTINDTFPAIKGLKIKHITAGGLTPVAMILGSNSYVEPLRNFIYGVDLPLVHDSACGKISFGVKEDRIYISTEIKDLKNEETIGVIEFNHWKLYRANMFDFYSDDSTLEVRDKQNNIALSLQYQSWGDLNAIYLDGYFINQESIAVLIDSIKYSDDRSICISKSDSNWKVQAKRHISHVRSIVPAEKRW